MNKLIKLAREIATKAHEGQYRRDKVTPYIVHPKAVADRLINESATVVATAWLHDVIEDTEVTASSLSACGIPESVIKAVEALTYTGSLNYEEYLLGVKRDWIAKKVKVADMICNLADSPTDRQIIKYARGLVFLLTP